MLPFLCLLLIAAFLLGCDSSDPAEDPRPEPVEITTLTVDASKQFVVEWERYDTPDDFVSYRLLRAAPSTSGGFVEVAAYTSIDSTRFTETLASFVEGTVRYRVDVRRDGGAETVGEEASFTSFAPDLVEVESVPTGEITLRWRAVAFPDALASYTVERAYPNGHTTLATYSAADDTTHTFEARFGTSGYTYRVRATFNDGTTLIGAPRENVRLGAPIDAHTRVYHSLSRDEIYLSEYTLTPTQTQRRDNQTLDVRAETNDPIRFSRYASAAFAFDDTQDLVWRIDVETLDRHGAVAMSDIPGFPDAQSGNRNNVSITVDGNLIYKHVSSGEVAVYDLDAEQPVGETAEGTAAPYGVSFGGRFFSVERFSGFALYEITDTGVERVGPLPVSTLEYFQFLTGPEGEERYGLWDGSDFTVYRAVDQSVVRTVSLPSGVDNVRFQPGSPYLWTFDDEAPSVTLVDRFDGSVALTIPVFSRNALNYEVRGGRIYADTGQVMALGL